MTLAQRTKIEAWTAATKPRVTEAQEYAAALRLPIEDVRVVVGKARGR